MRHKYRLSVHSVRSDCTHAHPCGWLISRSRGSGTIHKIMHSFSWCSHQAAERGVSVISVTFMVAWMLETDGPAEYFRKALGIFSHGSPWSLHRAVWKTKYTEWARVLWVEMPCWEERSEENVKDGVELPGRKLTVTQTITLYNRGDQKSSSACTEHWTLRWNGSTSVSCPVSPEYESDAIMCSVIFQLSSLCPW